MSQHYDRLSAICRDWARRNDDVFRAALKKNRVGKLGKLNNSIGHQVKSDNSGFIIQTQFKTYGRFVDMGAGRGQRANQISAGSKRKKKRWYSRYYWSRLYDLYGVVGYAQVEEIRVILNNNLNG